MEAGGEERFTDVFVAMLGDGALDRSVEESVAQELQ